MEPREELALVAPPSAAVVPAHVCKPLHLVCLAIIQVELRFSPHSLLPSEIPLPCRWPNKLNNLFDCGISPSTLVKCGAIRWHYSRPASICGKRAKCLNFKHLVIVPEPAHNILWIASQKALPIWRSTPLAFGAHSRRVDYGKKVYPRNRRLISRGRTTPLCRIFPDRLAFLQALPIGCSTPLAFAVLPKTEGFRKEICPRQHSNRLAPRDLPRLWGTALPALQLWCSWASLRCTSSGALLI